jgi:hypothetical protein
VNTATRALLAQQHTARSTLALPAFPMHRQNEDHPTSAAEPTSSTDHRQPRASAPPALHCTARSTLALPAFTMRRQDEDHTASGEINSSPARNHHASTERGSHNLCYCARKLVHFGIPDIRVPAATSLLTNQHLARSTLALPAFTMRRQNEDHTTSGEINSSPARIHHASTERGSHNLC